MRTCAPEAVATIVLWKSEPMHTNALEFSISKMLLGLGTRTAVFIVNATVIRSLGHGLRTFTAVPRPTQPCIIRGR